MRSYKMIGLKNNEHGERIKKRFIESIADESKVELKLEDDLIRLGKDIDEYTISIISSFEQVSFVEDEKIDKEHGMHKNEEHGHSHGPEEGSQAEKNILAVFLLNLFFSISEFIFGTLFSSQAILSDAVHDLGDALSIGLAYFFEKISTKKSSKEYSYGYRRFSLLGGLVTSVILIGGAIVMIVSTFPKLFNPTEVNHEGVFWLAIAAIIINAFSVKLMSGGKSSNEKLLNIHLFEDLFGWILVLLMSVVLRYTNWYILDPIVSLGIASWILYVTIPEFIRVSKIFLQAVPDSVDIDDLYHEINAIQAILMISHFHIWSTDGQNHMMSLIITTNLESNQEHEEIKQKIREIAVKYNISHISIEILYDPKQIITNKNA